VYVFPSKLAFRNLYSPLNQSILTLLLALGLATILILIRSSFRVAELSEGFGSSLANNQVTFMVLEGGMVASAIILLTVLHPGLVFERKGWGNAGWSFSGKPISSKNPREKLHHFEKHTQ
jgi:hypothetical protein